MSVLADIILSQPNERKQMAKGKAINVKVATAKVIKALQDALDKMNKQFDAEEKAQKVYEKEQAEYNKKVAEMALKQMAKAENVRVNQRWNGEINVDFNLPAGSIKMPKEPEAPKRELWQHNYENDKQELENAIRILKLTDEELVSTNTYHAVARFI